MTRGGPRWWLWQDTDPEAEIEATLRVVSSESPAARYDWRLLMSRESPIPDLAPQGRNTAGSSTGQRANGNSIARFCEMRVAQWKGAETCEERSARGDVEPSCASSSLKKVLAHGPSRGTIR